MCGISILADFRPMGCKLSCCVFALGKNVLFNSVLGHWPSEKTKTKIYDITLGLH